MIRSHFRQKEWPRPRKRKPKATVSKLPSDSEEIQVVADVHAAQEPPAPEPPATEPPASEPAAQVLVPFQRGGQGQVQVQVQAKVQVVTVTAQ